MLFEYKFRHGAPGKSVSAYVAPAYFDIMFVYGQATTSHRTFGFGFGMVLEH
jgi:hypothetical protein